jgi:hypothetical protein
MLNRDAFIDCAEPFAVNPKSSNIAIIFMILVLGLKNGMLLGGVSGV